MKSSTFSASSLLAVALFCIASCGQRDTNSTTETTTTTDTTTSIPATTTNAAQSTISTTPRDMMLVRHKVGDFNKWMTSYDAHDSMRVANGLHNYVIGRGVNDSNTVFVALKIDDLNKAKAFAKDPGLKQAMQRGGVTGTPLISFVTATYEDSAVINSPIRSSTTFTVKDWDRWQKSFDSTRQTRTDNGLMDRVYGHDADNNKKAIVVVALVDSTKAYAFWKSDDLKKMQAASGVTSQPQRFIYRIVKRY